MYLFAAEADKIQDVIFRSSKLKEALGASIMINDWCKDIVKVLKSEKYKVSDEDILVAGGGAFRLILSKENCKRITVYMGENYYEKFGTSISIALPVEINAMDEGDASYKEASATIEKNLRIAKNKATAITTNIHNPYAVSCSVCGRNVAASGNEGGDRTVICEFCKVRNEKSKVNSEYFNGVKKEIEGIKGNFIEIDSFEDLPREIAYISADINNMGMIFSACNKEQVRKLSQKLPELILESLVDATKPILAIEECKRKSSDDKYIFPIYPLILGGDDIFIVMEAKYAIDFMRRFTNGFLEKAKKLEGLEGIIAAENIALSVAIYFCKNKFPFREAHYACEKLLNGSKNKSRANIGVSYISFGNYKKYNENKTFRNSYMPYILNDNHEEGSQVNVSDLIDLREKYIANQYSKERNDYILPNSHLNSLHELYDNINIVNDGGETETDPLAVLFKFHKQRIYRNDKHKQGFEEIMRVLGNKEHKYFMKSIEGEDTTGLVDLLEFKEYLNKIPNLNAGEVQGGMTNVYPEF